jgi:hypothetical protein
VDAAADYKDVFEISSVITLQISLIRRDGGTQSRVTLDRSIVREYADAMRAGDKFPAVHCRFDGECYWLSDGFARLEAAELVGLREFASEVRPGSLEDAKFDSFAANSAHGRRRSPKDIDFVVQEALRHPKAKQLSNYELARHLNVVESKVRRWRKRLSTSGDVDTIRIVKRGSQTYQVETANIGRTAARGTRAKSLEMLRWEIGNLKTLASPEVRTLLTVLANWIFGDLPAVPFLARLEDAATEIREGRTPEKGAASTAGN